MFAYLCSCNVHERDYCIAFPAVFRADGSGSGGGGGALLTQEEMDGLNITEADAACVLPSTPSTPGQ